MIRANLAKRLTIRLRRLYGDIDTPPSLDRDRYFPGHRALATQADALRDEALVIFAENPDAPRFPEKLSTQTRISAGDGRNWRMVLAKSHGHVIKANARQAPVLTTFLKANPQVKTAAISYLIPAGLSRAITARFAGSGGIICVFMPPIAERPTRPGWRWPMSGGPIARVRPAVG